MPLYPVKNLKTGEQKEIHMLVEDYEIWRKENPEWDKDWSKGCAGLRTKDPSFYGIDAISSQETYEDKNGSTNTGNTRNVGNEVTASNQIIKDKFNIK